MWKSVLFWIALLTVGWLGLRHLITIFVGSSQDGPLKRGQRLCHATSFLLLIGSSVTAAMFKVWWPLLVGVVSEHLFRHFTIGTGEKFPLDVNEKQMSWKEFFVHATPPETKVTAITWGIALISYLLSVWIAREFFSECFKDTPWWQIWVSNFLAVYVMFIFVNWIVKAFHRSGETKAPGTKSSTDN